MKVKISLLWIPFLFLCFQSEMMKTLWFLFFMLSIHEAAHILVAKYFHYPIEAIILYPFGLCAKMRYIGMGNVFQELLIIIAGPLTHCVFPYLFEGMMQLGWISQSYAQYLCSLNHAILIFNLLPIFPLDGGRIMQSLYHMAFRYTTAQRLTMMSSVIHLFLLYYYQILQTWSAYVVMLFLLLQIGIAWRNIAFERLQFYHYRMRHPVHHRLRYNRKHDLFRANTNLLKEGAGWIMEDAWLQYYFHEQEECPINTVFL